MGLGTNGGTSPGTGTGTGSDVPRRLSVRAKDWRTGQYIYAGTGTGSHRPRPVWLTTLCSTLFRGRRLAKRVPGTGSGGWMYAGTGSPHSDHPRRQVWEFAECAAPLFLPITGTGTGTTGTACCPPGIYLPNTLFVQSRLLAGSCNVFDDGITPLYFGPPETGVADFGWGSRGRGNEGFLGGFKYFFWCDCVGTYPLCHWRLRIQAPAGSLPCPCWNGSGLTGTDFSTGGPYVDITPNTGELCQRPFCQVFTIRIVSYGHCFNGPNLVTCPCPAGVYYYELKVFEAGGEWLCGGSQFIGTGTGTAQGTGTAGGIHKGGRLANRGLARWTKLVTAGRDIFLQACCPQNTGTGTGSGQGGVPNDCEPSETIPETLLLTFTVTGGSCPDIDGQTIALVWDGSAWRGTFPIFGHQTTQWSLDCSFGQWNLFSTSVSGECDWSSGILAGGGGFPLVFTGMNQPGPTTCCPGSTITGTVTKP